MTTPQSAILLSNLIAAKPYSSLSTGEFHSLKGTAVEAVGNATGWTNWQRDGKQERVAGDAEYNAARAKGYTKGTGDRLVGKKDSVAGSLTGDRAQELSGWFDSFELVSTILMAM